MLKTSSNNISTVWQHCSYCDSVALSLCNSRCRSTTQQVYRPQPLQLEVQKHDSAGVSPSASATRDAEARLNRCVALSPLQLEMQRHDSTGVLPSVLCNSRCRGTTQQVCCPQSSATRDAEARLSRCIALSPLQLEMQRHDSTGVLPSVLCNSRCRGTTQQVQKLSNILNTDHLLG